MSHSSDEEESLPSPVASKSRQIPDNDHEFGSAPLDLFLKNDPRPTFALIEGCEKELDPIYLNKALLSNSHLMRGLPFHNEISTLRPQYRSASLDFIAWIRIVSKSLSARSKTFPFLGFLWTGFVTGKWMVISGDLPPQDVKSWSLPSRVEHVADPNQPSKPPSKPSSKSSHRQSILDGLEAQKNQIQLDATEYPIVPQRPLDHIGPSFVSTGTPDWTVANPRGELSDHIKLVRNIDWSKTSLGSMSSWTREFRQIVNHSRWFLFP